MSGSIDGIKKTPRPPLSTLSKKETGNKIRPIVYSDAST